MSKTTPSPARLEAFSDGVIAVIITIMVLELKVPREDGLAGLQAVLPTLLVYLLSFAFTAIYWVNHHHLVHRIERVDEMILYANLAFLFCLSLLPFFTNYLLEKKIDGFPVGLYAVSMMVTGFSFLLLRLAILRTLRRSHALEARDTAAQRKHLGSLALYLVSVPLAQFHPLTALATIALVTAVWIIPGIGVQPCDLRSEDDAVQPHPTMR
jgi:uncharacterized membrane protein